MNTRFQALLEDLTSNSKRLFLMDSFGAMFSAFLAGVVLVKFEDSFGMPSEALHVLAGIACLFAVYSMSCFLFLKSNWRPYLKAIAVANLLYCCLTIVLIFYYYQKLTVLGLIFFPLEVMVIVALVRIELMAVAKLTRGN